MMMVWFSQSTQEPYVFQVRWHIMINSKNEAARIKHVARRCKKYLECMTESSHRGTVLFCWSMELYNDQIEKSSSALKTQSYVLQKVRWKYHLVSLRRNFTFLKYACVSWSTKKTACSAKSITRVWLKATTWGQYYLKYGVVQLSDRKIKQRA